MDPNACIRRAIAAIRANDRDEQRAAVADYKEWLRKGGFRANIDLVREHDKLRRLTWPTPTDKCHDCATRGPRHSGRCETQRGRVLAQWCAAGCGRRIPATKRSHPGKRCEICIDADPKVQTRRKQVQNARDAQRQREDEFTSLPLFAVGPTRTGHRMHLGTLRQLAHEVARLQMDEVAAETPFFESALAWSRFESGRSAGIYSIMMHRLGDPGLDALAEQVGMLASYLATGNNRGRSHWHATFNAEPARTHPVHFARVDVFPVTLPRR